uniref:[histone H3]-lysine(4) N-trimethyltransferase n=1 Tax=Plectus sambesii TaxID=2011161 RepID=A0A914VCZ3_9BILA
MQGQKAAPSFFRTNSDFSPVRSFTRLNSIAIPSYSLSANSRSYCSPSTVVFDRSREFYPDESKFPPAPPGSVITYIPVDDVGTASRTVVPIAPAFHRRSSGNHSMMTIQPNRLPPTHHQTAIKRILPPTQPYYDPMKAPIKVRIHKENDSTFNPTSVTLPPPTQQQKFHINGFGRRLSQNGMVSSSPPLLNQEKLTGTIVNEKKDVEHKVASLLAKADIDSATESASRFDRGPSSSALPMDGSECVSYRFKAVPMSPNGNLKLPPKLEVAEEKKESDSRFNEIISKAKEAENVKSQTCARVRPYAPSAKKKKKQKMADQRVFAHLSPLLSDLTDLSRIQLPPQLLKDIDGEIEKAADNDTQIDETIEHVLKSRLPEIYAKFDKRRKAAQEKGASCARVRPISSNYVCARCRPFNGLRKEPNPFYFVMHPERTAVYRPKKRKVERDGPIDSRNGKGRWMVTAEMPLDVQYGRYLQNISPRIALVRSNIHGLGVQTLQDIDQGQLIIEYTGEIVRNSLVDLREQHYRKKGFGSYMFAVDNDVTVDATVQGGVARFINHSCDPNCSAKVVTYEGQKHIVLFANTHIRVNEELSYNYKLPIENEKLPCLCGAVNCRKFMN